MANFATVESGVITGVYDLLPQNTERVSNFFVFENNEEFLKTQGWYKLKKIIPEYNKETQKLGKEYHWFENDSAYESYNIDNLPVPVAPPPPYVPTAEELAERELQKIKDQWGVIRSERDRRISDFDWRYLRYQRQIRMGVEPTDSIEKLDLYIQQLADITNQPDPFTIIWPNYE